MRLYVFELIDMDGLGSAIVFDTVMAAKNIVLARVNYLILRCVACHGGRLVPWGTKDGFISV